jgi:SAM-dependent methyltransferase
MPSSDPHVLAGLLQQVRANIPLAIEQIDVVLRLLQAARQPLARFLDLGCGNGLLSRAILDEHPHAHGTLVDFPPENLAAAQSALSGFEERTTLTAANLADPAWSEAVQASGPFDAIVSGFACYPLPDTRQRALYGEARTLLQPDGLFLQIAHVASATRWTQSTWDDRLIDAIFGQTIQQHPGKTRAEIAAAYFASAPGPRFAPLEVQLGWLRELGFENVDCYLKVQELAVFGGTRAAGC